MWDRLPGGPASIAVFLCILVSYTTQTEAIQYIQHTLGYKKPLLLLYVTHSSFMFLLPIHLALIHVCTSHSVPHCCAMLKRDTKKQLSLAFGSEKSSLAANITRLSCVLFILTVALTIPSVSWFLAVPLTSMANIASIYNTFSLWALVFSVYFLKEPCSYLQVIAVLLGLVGVVLSAYGGATQPAIIAGLQGGRVISYALLGDVLALLGAISMAAYEIFYKRLAMIPQDELRGSFQPLSSDELSEHAPQDEIEGELPFGLHPIMMMTGIGAMTLCLFWIPLLFSHLFGIERIEWPTSGTTLLWILLSILCGTLFNGCFAILLSLWGPVLASMSCLLTTVLVQLTDVLLGIPFSWISMVGNLIITVSFACLLPW